MSELGLNPIKVRFFIWDSEEENEYDGSQGDYIECEEQEFIKAEGQIEYEKFTIVENGSRQVCLTKNPFK